jgi:DNA-binding NtrC family response regulator
VSNKDTSTLDLSSPKATDASPVQVKVSEGPDAGRVHLFSEGKLLIGSDGECGLKLEDAAVSRRHVELELIPGGVRVRDLGSRNGTFYLGAKVDQALVPTGGSVRIGRTTLDFWPPASAAALSSREELGGLVGRSVAMRALFAMLERLGPSGTSVLLQGETGTGKTAVAQALHTLGPRAKEPFVVVDCGALSPQLVESELFGHAKGAFTGADRDRPGAVDAANGGTLFLDEVGELPIDLQPKLLRLLEAREYMPLGSNTVKRADVRVVSATHRNLQAEVAAGRFRKDLYFRLAVTEIEIPPLRARPDDIAVLAARFARERSGADGMLTPATLAAFQCMQWPGNVRELKNAVERVLALGTVDGGADGDAQQPSFIEARDSALERFERDYLQALLEQHDGQVTAAAKAAKLARSHFYRLLERHGLSGKRG